jgi:hypothetical protein
MQFMDSRHSFPLTVRPTLFPTDFTANGFFRHAEPAEGVKSGHQKNDTKDCFLN